MPLASSVDAAALRGTLDERIAQHRADLEDLVRIPSVSAPGFDPSQVRRSAEAVRDLLDRRGFANADVLEVPANGPDDVSHPAVYAERLDAGPGAPTVLLYAHHDVQPPGDEAAWTSPAFEPTERDGRLYGRGTSDDKAGILVHIAAVDTWLRTTGATPVNVKVIIEGEEEIGSEHLDQLLATYGEKLRADVVVIADSTNWKVGVPSITYLLRGLVDAEVEVRGLDHGLHSGIYGGPVPDPLTGLVKLLAGLTDEHGAVAVPGVTDDVRKPTADERARLDALDFDTEGFRAEAGILDGVDFGGDPDTHVLEKLWMQPNLTIIGLDATSTATASNTIPPSAKAKVSLRLAPGQDPHRVRDVLCAHLEANAPWGLATTVTPGAAASPYVADPSGPAFTAAMKAMADAYGNPTVLQGIGGSIPLVTPLVEAFSTGGKDVPVLLTGVEDPDTRAHGIDESQHLDDFRNACLGEVYLLAELAASMGSDAE